MGGGEHLPKRLQIKANGLGKTGLIITNSRSGTLMRREVSLRRQSVYRGRGLGLPSEIKYPSSLLRQLPLQSHPAVMPGQPGRIQRVVHVAKPTSVSSKGSVGLGESYELNAIHPNGILQSQQRLAPKFFCAR